MKLIKKVPIWIGVLSNVRYLLILSGLVNFFNKVRFHICEKGEKSDSEEKGRDSCEVQIHHFI
jgi:hypothetical protein